jgi:hypothetical protein
MPRPANPSNRQSRPTAHYAAIGGNPTYRRLRWEQDTRSLPHDSNHQPFRKAGRGAQSGSPGQRELPKPGLSKRFLNRYLTRIRSR